MFTRELIWKVYSEDDTFIKTLNDIVISDLSIEKSINGGDSEFSFEISKKIDDFDENNSIAFNNRVKVYVKDDYNPNSILVAYGYIITYEPILNGKEERVKVTCLSAVSKLSNDFYRLGTSAAASDLGKELTSLRADEMMTDVITHYRLLETNSMISAASGLTQTTDNSGTPYSFSNRFFNMKHLDALKDIATYFPKNKAAGYWFYWRIKTDGSLVVKNISSTPEHKFVIGKHISAISGIKTIEGVVNRVYFWNQKGTTDPDYLKFTIDNTFSQTSYDVISDYISDDTITNVTAASLLAGSRVYDKKDPKVKISVTLNGDYDLASIEPGQTCQIFNLKNNPFCVGTDLTLIINTVKYNVDSVVLEISEPTDDFQDIIENERQRLEKEMTWFGYILQNLTAAQLGPADRTWTTDITFFATVGTDAYRQVDWSTGTVYFPTSSTSTSGKRVIDSGSTGIMTAGTQYYIYLDEETLSTAASATTSGTGYVKQGGDALYDSSASWTVDQYQGYIVTIGGQTKIIRSNTATVLTIEDIWTIADTTNTYTIRKMSFNYSTDEAAIATQTSIVFSTAQASTYTDSQASYSTTISTQNTSVNGTSQIADSSITNSKIISLTVDKLTAGTGIITNLSVLSTLTLGSASAYGTIQSYGWNGTANGFQLQGGASPSFTLIGGTLTSSAITGGTIAIGSSNSIFKADSNGIYLGNATYASAPFRVSMAGALTAISVTISGALTTDSGSSINADYISAGTLTGRTIRTAASGARIQLDSTNYFRAYDSSYLRLSISTSAMNFYNDSGDFSGSIYGATFIEYPSTQVPAVGVTGILYVSSHIYNEGNIQSFGTISTTGQISSTSNVYCPYVGGANGSIYFNQTGRIQIGNSHVDPWDAGSYNLGGATRYWGDISYKTLTDRGCLGWFDEGVELQDGTVVSDLEAIKSIKKHPTKMTIYGKPMLDYKTFPKVSYKPAADHKGKLHKRDKNDQPYLEEVDEKTKKKTKINAEDGIEMTSIFSIMIGAFKELDARLEKIEKTIDKK